MKKVAKTSDGQFIFYCPGCKHSHFFQMEPKKPAWTWNGDYNNPTVSPSINVSSGNEAGPTRCHFYIRDGKIEYLSDCTHDLAGQTVEMEEEDE